jgi:hypothetical protein
MTDPVDNPQKFYLIVFASQFVLAGTFFMVPKPMFDLTAC